MKIFFASLMLACATLVVNAQQLNNIDRITAAYIGVKNALVASNSNLTKGRSKELEAILAVPTTGLTASQQKIMTAYLGKIKADSHLIAQTNAIDAQRKHFTNLSANMYKLVSGLKVNSATLYQQYCPMKKAAWLSETEDIRNPYYGDKMLECGEVTATLKPVSAK
jgi:hypothetical protein